MFWWLCAHRTWVLPSNPEHESNWFEPSIVILLPSDFTLFRGGHMLIASLLKKYVGILTLRISEYDVIGGRAFTVIIKFK